MRSVAQKINQVKQKWIIGLITLDFGKVDKLLSAVDALTKQVNSLKSELWGIKNEKEGDKCYSGSKYLCRDCFNNNKNYCNHCCKCGSSSQMTRGCNTAPSGN